MTEVGGHAFTIDWGLGIKNVEASGFRVQGSGFREYRVEGKSKTSTDTGILHQQPAHACMCKACWHAGSAVAFLLVPLRRAQGLHTGLGAWFRV